MICMDDSDWAGMHAKQLIKQPHTHKERNNTNKQRKHSFYKQKRTI